MMRALALLALLCLPLAVLPASAQEAQPQEPVIGAEEAAPPPASWATRCISSARSEPVDCSISQRAVGGSMVQFASEHLKAKKIGYINHDDAYGGWNLEAAEFQAKKVGASEIIMGTRGLSRVSRFLLGSVAMKVVQLASVPVTLVK